MQQDRLWDHYQAGGVVTTDAFGGARVRHQFISTHVAAGEAVLNVGVGDGGLEHELFRRGCRVYSVDPSEAAILGVRGRLGLGERAKVGRCEDLPFDDGQFNVVVMSEVLEHLDNETLVRSLQQVRRVLTTSGRFVGTVPADEVIAQNSCLCPNCGTQFHRFGHVQSFNQDRLLALLRTVYAQVEISRYYFPDTDLQNLRGRIATVAKKMLMRVGVRGSNETLFFIAHSRGADF